MPKSILSREQLAVAHALRRARPEVSGDSRDALERVHWYELVRDVTSSLFGKPGVYTAGSRMSERWHEFANEAGYFSA